MKYKVVIKNFDSGLNELLHAQKCVWNARLKKMVVSNSEKKKNDAFCRNAIYCSELRGKKILKPLNIHYKVYARDKMRDKMNILSAFDKSFEDALQQLKIISNDGWSQIYGISQEFDVDTINPRIEVYLEEVE